jgi:hypothetical protein
MLKTSAGITLTRPTSYFDLIIVGHHPPEIDAAPFLQDLSYKGTCPRVLILREDEDLDFSPTLGAIGRRTKTRHHGCTRTSYKRFGTNAIQRQR